MVERAPQDDHVLNLGVLKELGATAMTNDVQIKMAQSGLPNTFVPGRNVLFFTLAAAIAYRRDIRVLVGGMCETDFSGYPDCRDDTISALQVTLSLAMDYRFTLETPLMWIDKRPDLGARQSARRRSAAQLDHRGHPYLLPGRTFGAP